MLMTVHVIIKQLPNINNTKRKLQERTLLEEFLSSRKKGHKAQAQHVLAKSQEEMQVT